jgi:asparagine synthase (glutamine-hydrolysing)
MKYLMKKALKGRVPDAILHRRKAGFPVPYQVWLQNDLREWVSDILLDRKTMARNYFKREAVEELIRRNGNGDYGKELFSLVALELWHRTFVDREQVGSLIKSSRELVSI